MSTDSWLLLSIFLFVGVAIANGLYIRVVKKARIVEPIFIFLFFFVLFVLPLPVRAYLTKVDEGDITEHLTALLPFIPFALFLCAVGLPLFTVAYYSKLSERIAMRIPRPKTGGHSRAAFFAIGGVSLLLLSLLARNEGGIIGFILLGYQSYEVTAGKGYLWVGLIWMPIAAEFLLYRYAVKREKKDLVAFLAVASGLILMFLVLGGRAPIVYFGLTVWLFWHHAVRPIATQRLVLIGAVLFLALNLVGALRESNYQNLTDVWQKANGTAGEKINDSESLFYTLTTGEFVVPFETLPQMIKSVGGEISPRYGLTYLEAPLFMIPMDVFPYRPLPLENWYMQKFYGDFFSRNEGRSFFFLAEGYLNFGPIGVFATMIVWGVMLGVAHSYIKLAKGEPGATLMYALTVAFVFRGIAGHSSSWISGLTTQAIGIVVIGIWIANGRIFGSFVSPSSRRVGIRRTAPSV
jgi:hypothetical protein